MRVPLMRFRLQRRANVADVRLYHIEWSPASTQPAFFLFDMEKTRFRSTEDPVVDWGLAGVPMYDFASQKQVAQLAERSYGHDTNFGPMFAMRDALPMFTTAQRQLVAALEVLDNDALFMQAFVIQMRCVRCASVPPRGACECAEMERKRTLESDERWRETKRVKVN